MKKSLCIIAVLASLLTACSAVTVPKAVKEGKVRIENLKDVKGQDQVQVHLMCFRKKPTAWAAPKQYDAGEHILWVRAQQHKRGAALSYKEGFIRFEVNLDADNSYILSQETVAQDEMMVWLQNSSTAEVVSKKIRVKLGTPLKTQEKQRRDQCREGTI